MGKSARTENGGRGKMIYLDSYLKIFIENNWQSMFVIYMILRTVFPDAEWLKRIGEAVSGVMPKLKKGKPS